MSKTLNDSSEIKSKQIAFQFIHGKTWLVNLALLLNDIIGFIVSIGLVTLVRSWFFVDNVPLLDPQVIRTIIILIVFSIIMLWLKGLYPGRGRMSVIEMKEVFKAIITAYATVAIIIFIQGENGIYSRSTFVLNSIFSIVVISVGRFLTRKWITKYPWWGEPVVIVGLESNINEVIRKLQTCSRLGFRPVLGLALDAKAEKIYNSVPILPWTINRQKEVHESKITTNILAISTNELKHKYPKIYKSVGLSFSKTIFILDSDIYGAMMAQPIDMNGQPAVISKQTLLNPLMRLVKLSFDALATLILAIPFLFIFCAISILIKMDSPGPVLYKQTRVGANRKPFQLFKFRTMVNNSDEVLHELLEDPQIKNEWENYHKIINDPRITKMGKWLRKYSLDESPQILNILRGEMSLIGPRPLIQQEIDEIGDPADLILQVKPGLTGWWQVNGRNTLTFEERIELDLFYVFNWSIWIDIFIFIKTFWVLVRNK
jgi:Undecaprenyl-phosphate galactose phosphotransferase WbaP